MLPEQVHGMAHTPEDGLEGLRASLPATSILAPFLLLLILSRFSGTKASRKIVDLVVLSLLPLLEGLQRLRATARECDRVV